MSYEVGQCFIQVVPSFDGVVEAISAEATKWGDSAGASFSDAFKARVDAALSNLKDVSINADTTEAMAKLDEIRTQLETLGNQNIGVDISEADAVAKVEALKVELDDLGAKHPEIKVSVDAAQAELELAAVAVSSDAAGASMTDMGGGAGGASAGLEGLAGDAGASSGAMGSMIPVIVALGAALVPIGGLAAGALAAIPAMAAGALTGIGALYLGFSGIGGALSAFSKTQSAPAISTGSSGPSALSTANSQESANNSVISAQQAVAAAKVSANQAVITSENNLVAAAKAVETAQAAEVTAQQNVNTVRNAAAAANTTAQQQEVAASKGVVDAWYNEGVAAQTVAQTKVTANQNVIAAENALVNAERTVTNAQYSEVQAQEAVVTARENAQNQLNDYTNQLADAGLAAQQAALDVQTTKAALDAAMAPNSGATTLQQQQAQLTYEQALQRVKDLATANQQLQQSAAAAQTAGIDNNPQVLAAEKQLTDAKQATTDALTAQAAAAANIQTVEAAGQGQILAAEYQLTQAKQAVTAAIDAQKVAAANVTTVATAGHDQIIAAEKQVQTAKQNTIDAINATKTAADGINKAEAAGAQSVENAERSLKAAIDSRALAYQTASTSASTGASPLAAYEKAMAGLTPAGRNFVDFITGTMYPVFEGLKTKVQAAFLPLVQTGLTDLMPFFKDLAPLIIAAAKGIGGTFDELAKFIGSKTGLDDLQQIFKAGNDFMSAMGGNFVTLFKAFTSIGSQATPIVTALAGGITSMVNSFAKWAEDGGFQKFMVWLQDNGPGLVKALLELVVGAGKLIVAFAPVGVVIDELIGYLSVFVGWVSSNWARFSDWLIIIGAAGVIITSLLGGPLILVGVGLVAVITGIIDLAAHWRDEWANIRQAASDAWQFLDQYLVQPIVNFFTVTIPNTFDTVVGFFKALPERLVTALGDVVGTVFNGLLGAASWIESHVLAVLVFEYVKLPERLLTALGDIVSTIFAGLLTAGTWIDDHVLTPVVNYFKTLPGRFVAGLGNIAAEVWSVLELAASWLDDHIATPILDFFKGLPAKIVTATVGMWDGISLAFKDAINTIIGWWDDFTSKLKIPGFSIGPVHWGGWDPGNSLYIPKFHDGGVVQGTPGVEQLAWLMPGEIVTPAQAAIQGGGPSRAFAPVFNFTGVDLSSVERIERVVTASFAQFADELYPMAAQ